MSKVPIEYQNFIDRNFLIYGEKYLFPFFRQLNLTANDITYLSIILSFYGAYAIYNNNYKIGAICFLIQYFFDCLDGHYARTYNMVSQEGDKLDHYKDLLIGGYVYYTLFRYWQHSKIYLLILLFLVYVLKVQLGCLDKYQQTEFNVDTNGLVFEKLTEFCKANNKNGILRKLKDISLIGNGTLILYTSILLYIMEK